MRRAKAWLRAYGLAVAALLVLTALFPGLYMVSDDFLPGHRFNAADAAAVGPLIVMVAALSLMFLPVTFPFIILPAALLATVIVMLMPSRAQWASWTRLTVALTGAAYSAALSNLELIGVVDKPTPPFDGYTTVSAAVIAGLLAALMPLRAMRGSYKITLKL